MKNYTKHFVVAFALASILLGIYGFIVFNNRNKISNKTERSSSQTVPQTDSTSNQTTSDTSSTTSTETGKPAIDSPSDTDSNENTPDEKNNYLNISKNDCDNQCKNFKDSDDLKYCQQVCGISPVKKDVQEKKGCDALQDLERDYCLKDLAITKKDIEICGQISDSNVLKTCKNRIAQDFIESQK